jgi:hypothetical protein
MKVFTQLGYYLDRYLEGSYHGNRLSENRDSGPGNGSEAPDKELVGEVTMSTGKKHSTRYTRTGSSWYCKEEKDCRSRS